jgi:hypothetical protein
MLAPAPPVIFLHIPKAGGTTLAHVARRQYPATRQRDIIGNHIPGVVPRERSYEHFVHDLPAHAKRHLVYVRGHVPFGLHETLGRPAVYVTMLRDPVDRLVSYYHYMMRTPHHYLHAEATRRGLSLADFAASDLTDELTNHQTKLLAGHMSLDGVTADEAMLEAAQAHLDAHFAVVGLTERFDASLVLMKRRLGWGDITYRRANVGRYRTRRPDPDPDVRATLAERNALDQRLYAYAARRLERDLRAEGLGLKLDLARLQAANRTRHAYHAARAQLAAWTRRART